MNDLHPFHEHIKEAMEMLEVTDHVVLGQDLQFGTRTFTSVKKGAVLHGTK